MKKYYVRDEGVVELTQHDGYLTYPVIGGGEERCPCMVFLLCDREALGTVDHPELGDVPACIRCATKLGYYLHTDEDDDEIG